MIQKKVSKITKTTEDQNRSGIAGSSGFGASAAARILVITLWILFQSLLLGSEDEWGCQTDERKRFGEGDSKPHGDLETSG